MSACRFSGVLAVAALFGGCDTPCEAPADIDGQEFDVFVTFKRVAVGDRAEFPLTSSPTNGDVSLRLDFAEPAARNGEVTVELGGQTFDGRGTFDEQQCGWFDLRWAGVYEGEAAPEAHDFSAQGSFVVAGPRLEGIVEWEEDWTNASGTSGTLEGTALFRGEARRSADAAAREWSEPR